MSKGAARIKATKYADRCARTSRPKSLPADVVYRPRARMIAVHMGVGQDESRKEKESADRRAACMDQIVPWKTESPKNDGAKVKQQYVCGEKKPKPGDRWKLRAPSERDLHPQTASGRTVGWISCRSGRGATSRWLHLLCCSLPPRT